MNLQLPDWLPRSNTVNLLAGAFLLSALYAAAQRRTLAAITAYRFNSLALGGIALTVALATGTRHIALAALLVIAVKGGVIPSLLRKQALRGGGALETEPYFGVPAGMLVCGALVVIAFSQTRALFGSGVSILASCLPVSVATTLVGMFLMVSRKQALMQVVGLVILENAIFLAAVSLTYGMPLVVEMGVLLDLLVGVALLGLFVSRIEQTHGSGDTTKLSDLKG
ncbi:MAG: hydrogenase [Candidatus Eisenbacteria bacterium]|uniref:Hydrogenase n=1 Tax=Eiseniibacteriota bacterium TaxID=2212470 RepID=A0A933WB40_UNCEI|nr:hydrogenase [Candidatus Eisenbacteria bacterium]